MIRAALGLLVIVATGATAQAADSRARPYRVGHYDVELGLDLDSHAVRGVVSLELASRSERLGVVELDCDALTIDAVDEAGQSQSFEVQSGTLRVTLRSAWHAGDRHLLRVRYHGQPRHGMRFFREGVFTAFNTQGWLPCDADPSDKATLTLRLIVPAGLNVLATGELTQRQALSPGTEQTTWTLEQPYSAYLFGLVVGRFTTYCQTAMGVQICAAAAVDHAQELPLAVKLAARALPSLSERAGVAFPRRRYVQVFLPVEVAQEMAGLSVMSEGYLGQLASDPRDEGLLLHELIHEWWGNWATAHAWDDLWLHEGITTFLVAAEKERHWGRTEYEDELAKARRSCARARANGQRRPLSFSGWTQPSDMGGPLSYRGGALVMNLLRSELGEAHFWSGLQRFTRQAAGGTVTSEELRRALERESGRDLQRLFAHWVYGADPPQLTARHHRDGGDLVIDIEQAQQPPWPIQLDVAVETSAGRVVRRLVLDKPRQQLHFDVGDAPLLSVRIDHGATLPVSVRHDRPVAMLLYQLAHEPDVVGRAEALELLESACAGVGADAACVDRARVLSGREPHEPSRFLRAAEHDALQSHTAP